MARLDRERLGGTVEVDETYAGGTEEGVRGHQLASKCLVVVAIELDGDRMGRFACAMQPMPRGAVRESSSVTAWSRAARCMPTGGAATRAWGGLTTCIK